MNTFRSFILKILLLNLLFLGSVFASTDFKECKSKLQRMKAEPAAYYFELRSHAKQEISTTGQSDFHFEPHKSVVQRILLDLRERRHKKFGDKYASEIQSLIEKAELLLAPGNPLYKATLKFVMYEYLPLLDKICIERHPQLAGKHFHKKNAEHLFDEYLAQAPDILISFTFESIDYDFFQQSRSAPFHMVGINLAGLDDDSEPPYADAFQMLNSEFAWHDWGHIDFMWMRDHDYLKIARKPMERVIWEWEATRIRVKKKHDEIWSQDKVLGFAAQILIAELLHERGFQYSLTVLKQELETPKWVSAVLRKKDLGYYENTPEMQLAFGRLNEARMILLDLVNSLRIEDQLNWHRAIRANIVPAVFTYTPSLGYGIGQLEAVFIGEPNAEISFSAITTEGRRDETGILEFLTAQVAPAQQSPLSNRELVSKLERILHLKKLQQPLASLNNTKVKRVVILANKEVLIESESGARVLLNQVSDEELSLVQDSDIEHFENLSIFKINQLLGTAERGDKLEYSIRYPIQKLIGMGQIVEAQSREDLRMRIRTLAGEEFEYPLVNIRVDPLSDGEF